MFLFCFSSSCVPYVLSFAGVFIFDCPFGILYRLFKRQLYIDNPYPSKWTILLYSIGVFYPRPSTLLTIYPIISISLCTRCSTQLLLTPLFSKFGGKIVLGLTEGFTKLSAFHAVIFVWCFTLFFFVLCTL